MNPRATYRIQFHRDFPFAAAADLAPYLARLGVSHVYASPILTARPGSIHGYDIIDHGAINPELGGEAGFTALADTLRCHGLGIVLDIVPNHMAVGGSGNRIWLDVLAFGRDSRFAHWFDINFQPRQADLADKILLPFLGESYGEVLAQGVLDLREVAGPTDFAIFYHDHMFPIRPADCVAIRYRGLDAFRSREALHGLLENQHYRLAGWRSANDRLNWRRFFDITELAALSVEHADVFEAVHAIPFRLYAAGLIDGLRIDHVDGLSDPAGYCRNLRRRLQELGRDRADPSQRAWLIVEKILAPGETLPDDWQTDGTSGYDFMNMVSALQHAPEGALPLGFLWRGVADRASAFEVEEDIARREILQRNFWGQLEELAARLQAHANEAQPGGDFTQAAFMRALTEIVSALRVYRSYRGCDGAAWEEAFASALAKARRRDFQDAPAFDVIENLTAPAGEDIDARREILRRLHQLCAPVAAKAVEDTAFYRYGRLLSRNDVGASPAQFSVAPAAFHAWVAAQALAAPQGMLTTATHDHKRGEDARARLAVLSEIPERWSRQVDAWWQMNAPLRPSGFAPDDEYQLYQTLIGCWPLLPVEEIDFAALRERVAGWQAKAMREAKLRSHWLAPDETYEQCAGQFLADILDSAKSQPFIASLAGFVASIAAAGAVNGLTQITLRCLLPGVPDLYQGREFWDFSLVDPDNRRPVDFAARDSVSGTVQGWVDLLGRWQDGHLKLKLIQHLLVLRRQSPALFASGSYLPLRVLGARADHVLAFRRELGEESLVVIAPLRLGDALHNATSLVLPSGWWGDTRVEGGPGHVLVGECLDRKPVHIDRRYAGRPLNFPEQTAD